MSYRDRLKSCGVEWPNLARPDFPFAPTARMGDALYVSGQIPEVGGEIAYVGKVGSEIAVDAAQQSARICAANVLFWVEKALEGDLDRVVRLARMNVFINAVPGFSQYSEVANGASQVMNAVFGPRGEHARCALGMAGLPVNVPVEIDAIFQVL